MGNRRAISLGLVMLVAVSLVVGLSGVALAAPGDPATGQVIDGPTTPVLGDPVGTDISPHGGYSATTDYCLQCHNIHAGNGPDYSLLRAATITEVCNTCHALGNLAADTNGSSTVTPNGTRTGRFDAGTGGTNTTTAGGSYDPAAVNAAALTVNGASWDPSARIATITTTAGPAPAVGAKVQISGVQSVTSNRDTTGTALTSPSLTDRYDGPFTVLSSGTPEVQRVTLTNFKVNGQSFTITLPASHGGLTTAGFVLGGSGATGYSAKNIKLALQGLVGWPVGSIVNVVTKTEAVDGYDGFVLTFLGAIPSGLVTVTPGALATSEVQTVTLGGGPTAGNFEIIVPAGAFAVGNPAVDTSTGALAFNAPATGAGSVQAALQAISGAASPTVVRSGAGTAASPYKYTVTWAAPFVGANAPQMWANNISLSGGTVADEIQRIRIWNGTGTNNFRLTLPAGAVRSGVPLAAETTAAIAGNAGAPAVQAAINALPSLVAIGATVSVTKTAGTPDLFDITYDSAPLSKRNIGQMTVAVGGGGTIAGDSSTTTGGVGVASATTADGSVPGTSEVQWATIGSGASGGNWQLVVPADGLGVGLPATDTATANIAFDATPAVVAATLQTTVAAIVPGATVTGSGTYIGAGSPPAIAGNYTLTFGGTLAGTVNVGQLYANSVSLSGGSIANEVQRLRVWNGTGANTFELTLPTDAVRTGFPSSPQYTVAIPGNASAATVDTELEALPALGAGSVSVVKTAGTPDEFEITFNGTTVRAKNIGQMTVAVAGGGGISATTNTIENGTNPLANGTTTQGGQALAQAVALVTAGAASATSFQVAISKDPGTYCNAVPPGPATAACAGFAGPGAFPNAPNGASVNPKVTSTAGNYVDSRIGNIYDPAPGTAATRTAYDLQGPVDPNDITGTFAKSAHEIGASAPPGEDNLIQFTANGFSYGSMNSGTASGQVNTDGTWKNTNVDPDGTGFSGPAYNGLNCASCHTPHGEYGQLINARYVWVDRGSDSTLINNKIALAASGTNNGEGLTTTWGLYQVKDGTIVYANNYDQDDWVNGVGTGTNPGDAGYSIAGNGGSGKAWLHLNTTTPSRPYWEACIATPTTNCKPWVIKDQAGQIVSAYGYKLLSGYPNHTYKVPSSWGTSNRITDMDSWCGKCHPSRVDASFPRAWTEVPGYDVGTAGTYHNHPTACTYCHGNPSLPDPLGPTPFGVSKDFPHTSSTTGLLKQYPDGLCISCHQGLP